MQIDIDTIIKIAGLIGALAVIAGVLVAAYKFYQKPKELEARIERLR